MNNEQIGPEPRILRQNYLHGKLFFANMHASNKRPSDNSIKTYEFRFKNVLCWAGETPLTQAHTIRPSLRDYILSRKGKERDAVLTDSDTKEMEIARKFFLWAKINLSREYKAITEQWINDLVPTTQESSSSSHIYVTHEEAIAIATFPIAWENLPMKRAQAGFALGYLTGARVSALGSLPIQAADVMRNDEPRIYQWPIEFGVRTKGGKKGTTFLLPIPELLSLVREWHQFVQAKLSPTAMWYPVMKSNWGEYELLEDKAGKNRNQAIADDFQALYRLVGMPYKSPHACRHGHAVYVLERCKDMAQYQDLSRNLMHSSVSVTDRIYAEREEQKRGKSIAGLPHHVATLRETDLEHYLSQIGTGDIGKAIHILSGRLCA